jgi:hypothetical protein
VQLLYSVLFCCFIMELECLMIQSLPSMMVPEHHILDRKKGTKRKEFEMRVAVFTGFTNEESKGRLRIENHKSEKLIIKRINN